MTNRALICAALADGTTVLQRALLSEDTRLMIDGLTKLGVSITVDEEDCAIEISGMAGHLPNTDASIHCGNSGTTIRFLMALAALSHGRYEFDGIDRMRQRPVDALGAVLQSLGAGVEYLAQEGYPPLAIRAVGLHGGTVSFRSPVSSQFVTALLLVAPYAGGDLFIEVTGETPSLPYLKMTAAVMDAFGVSPIEQYDANGAKFIVETPQRYGGCVYGIEPDASSASYFLAAPAIAGGTITVRGLGTNSIQGDAQFVDVLEQMGCTIDRSPQELSVTGPDADNRLRGIDVDLRDMPDVAQTLAVVALFADGPTTIRNIANLRFKETDRLSAMTSELTKLGASVKQTDSSLSITPPEKVTPATIETYNDHRMAMSFALAGLRCMGVKILDPECCGKTFPDYFEQFGRLTVKA